jgi:hypothetical protein
MTLDVIVYTVMMKPIRAYEVIPSVSWSIGSSGGMTLE